MAHHVFLIAKNLLSVREQVLCISIRKHGGLWQGFLPEPMKIIRVLFIISAGMGAGRYILSFSFSTSPLTERILSRTQRKKDYRFA